MSKNVIQDLLAEADITVNGKQAWDINIKNDQFFQRLLTNTDLALGESYMDSWWDCSRLDEFFYRLFNADLPKKVLLHPKFWRSAVSQNLFAALRRLFNYQTKNKALEVGKKHYDVGNDLYLRMLDKRMNYSCAYWEGANTLEQAQENKLELICRKLQLQPGMTLLDIGCGWGSMAKYAAEQYGVSVVGVTISQEQLALAKELCAGLPIDLRFQDYRDFLNRNEKFDRIVSIGMFEHVGFQNYPQYMQTAAHCLKDDGLFLLHTIGSLKSNTVTSHWINTYIFPNGQLPSLAQIGTALEGNFVMEDCHNIGIHYDRTLMAWYENFNNHWDEIKKDYDERFRRMWNYYLLSSAATFRARKNQVWQFVLSKNGVKSGYKRPNL